MNQNEPLEPTPYLQDKFDDQLHKYGTAREMLSEADTEELIGLVEEMGADLGELYHDEFAVYSTARDVLTDRGFTFEPGDDGPRVVRGET